jgi:hypothetical protein
MKHDLKADMKREGETLKAETKEPPAGDPQDRKMPKQFALPKTAKKAIPFMDVPGSDPSAVMKGDNAQFVKGSTAPGTPVQKPQKVGARGYIGGGQFNLPKSKK